MRRSGWIALLSVLLAGGGFLLGVFTANRIGSFLLPPSSTSAERPARQRDSVFALGKLQPAGGNVPVVGPPGDRVADIAVRSGDKVITGKTLLVELASYKDREQEVILANHQLDEAGKQLAAISRSRAAKLSELQQQTAAVEATRNADLEAQKLKIGYLRKQAEAARKQQARLAGLNPNVVDLSAQEKEKAALAVSQAQSELDSAVATRDALKRKYALQQDAAKAAYRSAEAEMDLARDRVPIESLQQSLKLARMRRDHARIYAPVDGTVVDILAHTGDPTGTGPILQIAAGSGMVAIAEVYATDVEILREWFRQGQTVKASITGAALGEKTVLTGRLSGPQAISSVVARNSVSGFSPRAESDRRVVEVRVELDAGSSTKASRYVGLEVNIELNPKSSENARSQLGGAKHQP